MLFELKALGWTLFHSHTVAYVVALVVDLSLDHVSTALFAETVQSTTNKSTILVLLEMCVF